MARIAFTGSAAGTGTVTLSSPNTDDSYTLTLPATTGTVLAQDSSNIVNLAGSGVRITGDFSNATVANRVIIQSNTTNGVTGLWLIPNGSASISGISLSSSSDPANASIGTVTQFSGDMRLAASLSGTGSYTPLTFYTGGSERMRIDTSGNVGIGTNAPIMTNARLSVKPSGAYDPALVIGSDSSAANWARADWRNANIATSGIIHLAQDGSFNIRNDGAYPLVFYTNGATEQMRIAGDGTITAAKGNVLLVSETAKTATGTAVEFTNIPSWVKRITLMLAGVSTNGTGHIRFQLGTASGYVISGYNTMTTTVATTANTTLGGVETVAFSGTTLSATTVSEGQIVFNLLASNIWTGSGMVFSKNNNIASTVGSVSLGGTLDRVRVIASTTGSPADTFDAGTINIMYE